MAKTLSVLVSLRGSVPSSGIGASNVASQALARLDTFAITQSSGAITHRYKPEAIIHVLELKFALTPRVSLGDVFGLVAPFLFDVQCSLSLKVLFAILLS